ncbi:hypothetical protein Tco_0795896 [Tanacetum coccineum]
MNSETSSFDRRILAQVNRDPRTSPCLASAVIESKFKCDNLRCRNQDLVFKAFDKRQMGEDNIISSKDKVYKFEPLDPLIDELRAVSGHMLGVSEVQIPENNLDNLKSTREEDGVVETLDPQFWLGFVLLEMLDSTRLDLLFELLLVTSLSISRLFLRVGVFLATFGGSGFLGGTTFMEMTTLVKFMIVAGAENRPPMLDKAMYNSWESHMLLYIKGKKNGRMMLESIENGPLVYPTIEVDGLPPDVYALVNHCQSATDIWERVKLLMKGTELSYQQRECKLYNEFDKFTSVKGETLHEYYLRFAQLIYDMHIIGMTMQKVQSTYTISSLKCISFPSNLQQPPVEFPQIDSGLVVLVFLPGDDPIACLNKAMAFISTVVAFSFLSTNNQLRTSSNLNNQATIQDGKGEGHMARQCTQPTKPHNGAWFKEKLMLAEAHESGQVLDEEQLAFLADLGITDCHDVQPTIIHNAAF